jgi:CheY-like chemotaxis protein
MGKTIMIVDDEPDIQESFRQALEYEGYKIEVAGDGSEFLKKVKDINPDLVLLDVMMPGIGTTEILEEIEKDDSTKDLKIIIITVVRFSQEDFNSIKKRKNIVDVVNKPVKKDVLLEKIRKNLKD